MRALWIFVACVFISPLAAVTLGNVELILPPSKSEWKLFSSFEDETLFSEEGEDGRFTLHIYTHKEGDALETLVVSTIPNPEDDEEDEMTTKEMAQKWLDESIGKLLPNHNIIINGFEERKNGDFVEWEINDGTEDILHGFLLADVRNKSNRITMINYTTTAAKRDQNTTLWTHVLKQSVILD